MIQNRPIGTTTGLPIKDGAAMAHRGEAAHSLGSRLGWFALLVLGAALVFFPVLAQILAVSLREQQYSHLPLIPLVTLYLFWIDREGIFQQVKSAPLAGSLTVGAGLGLACAGWLLSGVLSANDSLSMMTLGWVVAVWGLFIACFGSTAARSALFPLGFLLFMVPIPGFALDAAIVFLQKWSAETTFWVFKLLGVPVFREGFLFSIPRLNIEVARECSGIRSSIALTITAVLAGRLFFDSWRSRVILVLCVIPLTVLKNAIRIVGLCLLSIYVDEGFMRGGLHRDGGIAFFILALILASPLFLWLRRAEKSRQQGAR